MYSAPQNISCAISVLTLGNKVVLYPKMVEGIDTDVTELLVQEKPAHNHTFFTEQIYAIDLEVLKLLRE